MIRILKASAGSGKTYNLAKTYISLLLKDSDDHAYRHILAVTFTNKATAEMKGRILKELHILAADPARSKYFNDFVPSLFPDGTVLKDKAGRVLVNILHDYGAFSVSTIDKFFQMTLKAFSREIGMFASYQVELDKKSLVHESVDRILDSLTEESEDLIKWLDEGVKEQLRQGSRVNVEKGLYEVAERLKSEEQRELSERRSIKETDAFSKERLEALRGECDVVIDGFQTAVPLAAKAVVDALKPTGVALSDTFKGFLSKVQDYCSLEPGARVVRPSDSFMTRAADPEAWFSKANAKLYLNAVEPVLSGPLNQFLDLFGISFDVYNTAVMLKDQTFDLGLAAEFYAEFSNLLKEKNVLGIDDSNTLLCKIIGDSDAPFVYEKLGVRYEHFLLDEFQDTSNIQWRNFQPLLSESNSNNNENLVVGDVKQSIYRWRGSDWHLLASELNASFPSSETEALKENWRSCANVVRFNNAFFPFAAESCNVEAGLYSDVEQVIKSKDGQEGHVQVTFCKKELELEEVCGSVDAAHAAGAGYGEIAVLVRTNSEGGSVADALREHGIPVISDDSLNIKASLTVRRLVSLLSFVENPEDKVNGHLASSLGVTLPEKCISLVDLSECLLRDLEKKDPELYRMETLYIQSFMDLLQEWCAVNGNSLVRFLKHWDEIETPCLSSPEDADAVRIMTIHKSKGLEFPHVIFPFAESVGFYKWDWHWCVTGGDGNALPSADGSMFPVCLNAAAEHSMFAERFQQEKEDQMVDNLNTVYVAFTRAAKSLHVISCTPPASLKKDGPKNFSQLLYLFARNGNVLQQRLRGNTDIEDFEYGSPYDFNIMERESSTNGAAFSAEFRSFPLGDRLRLNADASDFFGDDGSSGAGASHRLNGIVLHDILSSVCYPSELRAAVDAAVYDGRLSREEGEQDFELLSERISSVKERGWFPDDRSEDVKIINEGTIIDADGSEHRPDRVVVYPDRTVIIDYKFGESEEYYKYQIMRYVRLYRKMGYRNVSGCLWYVFDDIIDEKS